MSKKIISAFLVLGLLVAFSGPAVAKKKKGPKPYTSEEATINVGHPVFYGNSGTLLSATAQEFLNTCAIPQSNGVDAFVYEIPANYAKLSSAAIQAFGSEGSPGRLRPRPIPVRLELRERRRLQLDERG